MNSAPSLGRRKVNPFRQPVITKPRVIGPEYNPWYWNPGRIGARQAPGWFQAQLEAIDVKLGCTWNPLTSCWQVFTKAPRFVHPICSGWRLLFVHHDGQGKFAPLDERLFARLFEASVDVHGSAKEYFNRIQREAERDKEKRDKQSTQDSVDAAMPGFEFAQIKNIGQGNKFVNYHA